MLRFFNKKDKGNLIENNVSLASVHIPKTAGTSFRNILKQVYGEQALIRLDIHLYDEKLLINETPFAEEKLSPAIQVAHGHFSPALLHKYFHIAPTTPFITWLRDPVERVISNYYYLEKRLKEELQEEAKGLNILSKMQRSLLEYAGNEINQNRMGKFLKGMELEDFLFVGIQEFYSEELQQLANLLGWSDFQEPQHNRTGQSKRQVSQAVRDGIASYNKEDVALYQRALDLREKRTRGI